MGKIFSVVYEYKLVVTVASNNLTVALKHVDGTDPSVSNPIHFKIHDTMRSVTAALSVTKNAGTSWCNAGSAELATNTIDYFVYLGFNAIDGVTIGFSRIPYARTYSEFSTTSTNEKYAAISTITNAAASDPYINIGRFAATLSAGAGYTWSVPAYTALNLVQRPIFETRYGIYTPQVTSQTGTITTLGTVAGNYQLIGGQMFTRVQVTITTNGTAAGGIKTTLPFSAVADQVIAGNEAGLTGKGLTGYSAVTYNLWRLYDGTHPGANGAIIVGSGFERI